MVKKMLIDVVISTKTSSDYILEDNKNR